MTWLCQTDHDTQTVQMISLVLPAMIKYTVL